MRSAKLFLREVRNEQREVQRLGLKLEYLKKSILPGGIRYDVTKIQCSPDDKITDLMAEIGDVEIELEADIRKLVQDIHTARQMIRGLGSSIQRDVLTRYYLPDIDPGDELPTWKDIAISMHYSEHRILHIHGEALQQLNDKYKKISIK